MTSKATVITVSYNSARDLAAHWGGAADLMVEWIVVDNASSDDSAAVAEALGARVIRLPRNLGFSAANNVGAALATSDFLIFANPDVEATAEGVADLVAIGRATGGLVGPQLMNPDGTLQENGRKSPFLYRKAQHFLGHEGSASNYELRAESDETWRVSWLTGAVIGMKREVFDDLGGWDSGFFVYHEDSDLCIRARLRGYPVLLTGTTRWVHAWGRATRSWSWNSWKLELRSAARFYRKYPALLLHPSLVRLRRGIRYSSDDVARYHL